MNKMSSLSKHGSLYISINFVICDTNFVLRTARFVIPIVVPSQKAWADHRKSEIVCLGPFLHSD